MPIATGMAYDDLDEVEENIRILVLAELEAQHRLGAHQEPVTECRHCVTCGTLAG